MNINIRNVLYNSCTFLPCFQFIFQFAFWKLSRILRSKILGFCGRKKLKRKKWREEKKNSSLHRRAITSNCREYLTILTFRIIILCIGTYDPNSHFFVRYPQDSTSHSQCNIFYTYFIFKYSSCHFICRKELK